MRSIQFSSIQFISLIDCSLILSQCRDLRMDVIRKDLGALTTVRGTTCKTVLNLLEADYLRFRLF